jgi:lipopolysaccharide/colanic/teichoic acid biosynthesis glycosyltransferase
MNGKSLNPKDSLYAFLVPGQELENGIPEMAIPSPNRLMLRIKRIIDIILALGGLLLASPLFIFCILMTYWQLGRPIFFTHDRLGMHGKLFKIWKFRSMLVNARAIVHAAPEMGRMYAVNYKIPCSNCFLVPFWGRIMRKTSLDELPQLLNVLRGEMSIVGPRPVVPPEIKKYGGYGEKLLSVKPGLTGYWQVSGRNNIAYPERVYYDMYYIDHQSIALDFKIILRTIWVLLTMDGSV